MILSGSGSRAQYRWFAGRARYVTVLRPTASPIDWYTMVHGLGVWEKYPCVRTADISMYGDRVETHDCLSPLQYTTQQELPTAHTASVPSSIDETEHDRSVRSAKNDQSQQKNILLPIPRNILNINTTYMYT